MALSNNNEKNNSNSAKKFHKPDEVDFAKLFRIINRRKWLIISSVVLFLTLAFLYNIVTKPTYESKVLLKKEKTQKSPNTDKLTEIISLQTADEIETELELVKTSDVLNKVVEKLNLFASVEAVQKGGTTREVKQFLVDYNKKNKGLVISEAKFTDPNKSYDLTIEKSQNGYKINNLSNYNITEVNGAHKFSLSGLDFIMKWDDAKVGDKISLKLESLNDTRKNLNNNVNVEQKAKTDVFEVIVTAPTPYSSKIIADEITEEFRAARIDQQKQTIRYSFDFVDQNLEDIKKKLEEAENSLSQYKAANQIMDIDGSSQDLVQFLSTLEAEKLTNELQLTDYRNKYGELSGELKNKGFFDQTFLSPQGNEPTNSPFSNLMRQQSDLELKRLELLEKRKESHPDVVAIDKQLGQVKKKLSTYNENTLTSYNIMINSLNQKEDRLNSLMNKYESKMRGMPEQENKLAGLIRQKNVYTKMYTMLLDKREEMRMAELSKLQDIVVVDPAREPVDPVLPRKKFNLVAGLILGIFVGFAGVFVAEFKSKKHVNLDDIENDFKLPIFAIIPAYSKEITSKIEGSNSFESRFINLMPEQDGFKESFRVLRTKLSTAVENKSKVILFTSCEENTGKSTLVANLGISYANARKKVLIIDCDLKKATLSRMFDIEEDVPGLIPYLKRKIAQPYTFKKAVPSLDILPSGGISENSGDLLGTERMKNLFSVINSSSYDYILIDTPPVTRVVDVLVLGKFIENVVLIVRPDHTFKDSVQWGIQELENENMNILGTVVNAANIEKSSFRYRYGYGYGYSYGQPYKRIAVKEEEPQKA